MSARESNTWDWLRGARKAFGPELFIRRLENAVSTGDADVDGSFVGDPFYIELKAGNRPARPTTVIRHEPVKDEQVTFADAVLAAGASHSFLVQVGSGAYPERRFFVIPGHLGRWLQSFRTEAELAEFGTEVYGPGEAIATTIRLIKELSSDDY